ncbi:unnamed protein product [Rotaria sp. Silwood2]|nr:unnamed protein product [Rotaria sp. Silwood2]CAF2513867.1 unnamed protein product [Rotaria sp. Silwood2]CAF2876610.1 unnamed protein product [Rotaria sp. Silwood2]CAF3880408.1 unnamed protein product [Rotaria sp. Silwood2]CAF4006739.1 unnamed protein product [Rotaria sp. Silwood2]
MDSTMDGKELKKNVIARARVQFIDEINMNLIRSLAMNSFNCLISVLTCTKIDAKLYTTCIFDSNASKVIEK